MASTELHRQTDTEDRHSAKYQSYKSRHASVSHNRGFVSTPILAKSTAEREQGL